MKIWCISDTHCHHSKLTIPKDIDMIIHAGDAGGHRDTSFNEAEMKEFMIWFSNIPCIHKIYIPGNHDTSVEADMIDIPADVIVLKHESVEIEGIKIFGSPYTPPFSVGWAYNVKRTQIEECWKQIPTDTDIIVTHGPAKGILDYTAEGNSTFVQCGCKSLLNAIKRVSPQYHIFGHIHDETDVLNCGTMKPSNLETTFVNACVMNLKYEVVNNGIIIEI